MDQHSLVSDQFHWIKRDPRMCTCSLNAEFLFNVSRSRGELKKLLGLLRIHLHLMMRLSILKLLLTDVS